MGKIFDSIILLMVKWWSNGGQMIPYMEDGTHYSHPSIQKFLDPLSYCCIMVLDKNTATAVTVSRSKSSI
jgi:hypothetical protein